MGSNLNCRTESGFGSTIISFLKGELRPIDNYVNNGSNVEAILWSEQSLYKGLCKESNERIYTLLLMSFELWRIPAFPVTAKRLTDKITELDGIQSTIKIIGHRYGGVLVGFLRCTFGYLEAI